MASVVDAIYGEFGERLRPGQYTERNPLISSLRRNLQSEMTARLIDLSNPSRAMPRPIQTLAMMHLRQLNDQIEGLLNGSKNVNLDTYSRAHLEDIHDRIGRALNAVKIAS